MLKGKIVDIQFRRALPEDAKQAAGLICDAGPEAMDYAFATKKYSPVDFVSAAFINGSGIIGYKNHVVAAVDGQVAGIGAFYAGRHFGRLSLEMIWQIIRFYGPFACWRVLRRGSHLETLMPAPDRDALFIQNFAVAKEMQNKGIATALLQHRLQLARQANFRSCLLDVAMTNRKAKNLYEKMGFRVVEKRSRPITDGHFFVPGHERMALYL